MRIVIAPVLVALGCAACASALQVSGPLTTAPSASMVTPSGTPPGEPSCVTDRVSSGSSVDEDPTGVQLAWLPGMNMRPCRSVLVRGVEAQARRLAHDLDHLPSWPAGRIDCPSDDGAAVELIFAYSGGDYEQIVVGLTGCAGVAGHEISSALASDLRALAPEPWRHLLQE